MRHSTAYRDEEIYLIEKAKGGDDRAWRRLIESHLTRIRALGDKFGVDRTDAESIGLEKLFSGIMNFRPGDGVLWTYVKGNITRALIDQHRSKFVRDKVSLSGGEEEAEDILRSARAGNDSRARNSDGRNAVTCPLLRNARRYSPMSRTR
jgi:DNA-directed RNA polymerase specialized sigma subunit